MKLKLFVALFAFGLSVLSLSAQNDKEFDRMWNVVDSLEEIEMIQDAKGKVMDIDHKARREKNYPQQVKALLYQFKYAEKLGEVNQARQLRQLKDEMLLMPMPHKAVLQSMVGSVYMSFVNAYADYNDAEMEPDTNDPTTWTEEQLKDSAVEYLVMAIQDEATLTAIPVENYAVLLDVPENTQRYKPTLYDVLAFRLFEFYAQNRSGSSTGQHEMSFLFGDATVFVNARLTVDRDKNHYEYRALALMQKLLRRYINIGNTDALVMADIRRIEYCHSMPGLPEAALTGSLVLPWYKRQIEKYAAHRVVTELLYRAADLVSCRRGFTEFCSNTLALEYCNRAISQYPNEPATQKCRDIKNSILEKSFETNSDQSVQANDPFRFLIRYKNVSNIYFRFIPVSLDSLDVWTRMGESESYDAYRQKLVNQLLLLKPEGTTTVALPTPYDYRWRSTEWYHKGLKPGHYVMLASIKEDFSADSNVVQYSSFWSTEYAITGSPTDSGHIFFLTKSDDGQPVKNAILQFYGANYVANGKKLVAEKTTNALGMVEIRTKENHWGVTVKAIVKGKEVVTFSGATSLYQSHHSGNDIGISSKIYTDRAIYRPGQTVYYKGIVYTGRVNMADNKVLPNYTTTVKLTDANGMEVATQEVQTNRFGSYSGSFIIPYGMMTGYFTLGDEKSSQYIQVEEYKRPKFKVEFDTLKTAPSFNDSVTFKGKALAYAGNAISHATVQYEVVRYTPFMWYAKWEDELWTGQNTSLQTGTIETAEDGTFSITFKALPGEDPDRTYTYEVITYVTDINGETQEGKAEVRIGTRTVVASFTIPGKVFPPKPASIFLNASNLSGTSVPLKGRFVIHRLETPGKLLRERRWEKPDTQIISRKQFEKLFPNDIYDETVSDHKTVKTVFEKTIDNASGFEKIEWDTKGLSSGLYKAVFEYPEKNGKLYTYEQTFSVINPAKKQPFGHEALAIADTARLETYHPGQTAELIISSRAKKSHVFYIIERRNKKEEIKAEVIKSGIYKIKIPVTEDDRGGIIVTAFTIYNNRFYKTTHHLYVPWDNRTLDVEITSYRDKMLPGSKEEWTLKIKGPGAQKISAEVLASMYDASLDRFTDNTWDGFGTLPYIYSRLYLSSFYMNYTYGHGIYAYPSATTGYYTPEIQLQWHGWMYDPLSPNQQWYFGSGEGGGGFGNSRLQMSANFSQQKSMALADASVAADSVAFAPTGAYSSTTTANASDADANTMQAAMIKVRRNMAETAFFYPHLETSDSGTVTIKFTAPEALTQWNFRALAHTTDLMGGTVTATSVTTKPLMVQPNLPRFLRVGDEIYISAKIVNTSKETIRPNVVLEVYDALTGKNIKEFNNINQIQVPQMAAGVSEAVKWKFAVPDGYEALKIVIKAFDGNYTDAEANTLPVLSDKILVTEALPLPFSGSKPKTYELKKLTQSGQSNTLKHHKVTVEFTSNPAWYAIQALPYMMEYPYECAEQVFNRFYANALGYHIANSNPAIENVFNAWKAAAAKGDEGTFISGLEQNEELKNILLNETPWAAEGRNESERKQRLGLLFDKNVMENAASRAIDKLLAIKHHTGSYPWFTGMSDNRHITQYIVAGLGRLGKITGDGENYLERLDLQSSLRYMHRQAANDYAALKANKVDMSKNQLGFEQIQYLYAISFFEDMDETRHEFDSIIDYWETQAAKYWAGRDRMSQAMIAIALHRMENETTPGKIITAFRQNAITHEEMGMYWKDNTGGHRWNDAPVETQVVIIEAFNEITTDTNAINLMRKWLLKQKQVNEWQTTKATADACYALLLNGTDWLETGNKVEITLGGQKLDTQNDPELNEEAGTGYIKKSFDKTAITPEMGRITVAPVDNENIPAAWGALYWQYFERMDKITRAQTPLSIIKQLYVEKTTDTGMVKTLLKSGDKLKVGDKLVVRILIKTDRNMDYVHIKDMRAAALEPTQAISGYTWQGGLGYYTSIRDAAMNFFIDNLPKGQWMFEYDLRVSQAGTFQNGITTVQNMYAPEYTSHSEGMTIVVEP